MSSRLDEAIAAMARGDQDIALRGASIGDADAVRLAAVLKLNTTITSVDLGCEYRAGAGVFVRGRSKCRSVPGHVSQNKSHKRRCQFVVLAIVCVCTSVPALSWGLILLVVGKVHFYELGNSAVRELHRVKSRGTRALSTRTL